MGDKTMKATDSFTLKDRVLSHNCPKSEEGWFALTLIETQQQEIAELVEFARLITRCDSVRMDLREKAQSIIKRIEGE